MAELKTQKTKRSVADFLNGIEDEGTRTDCQELCGMMEKATGGAATMWGAAIVGFGEYHYKYASGREGDWFVCGFSPRKQNLSLYVMGCDLDAESIKDLGKFKRGKACLYIKKLNDINREVLQRLLDVSAEKLKGTSERP